ncbi:hypothetical protein [Rouxiella badensis]
MTLVKRGGQIAGDGIKRRQWAGKIEQVEVGKDNKAELSHEPIPQVNGAF